jgi:glc operon protein GlcG
MMTHTTGSGKPRRPVLGLALLLWIGAAGALGAEKPALTEEAAKRIAAAAAAEAQHLGLGAAIVVVDGAGHILHEEHFGRVPPAAREVALAKARAAYAFERSLDPPLHGLAAIVAGGHVVGGIGVNSIGTAEQEDQIAAAGARAL